MFEESIGVNRETMKLMNQVFPHYKRYLRTDHGLSKDCYGGIKESLGGQGKGNVFSGSVCRDMFHVLHLKKRRRKDLE